MINLHSTDKIRRERVKNDGVRNTCRVKGIVRKTHEQKPFNMVWLWSEHGKWKAEN